MVRSSTYNDGRVPALRLLVLVELCRADGALASLFRLGVCLACDFFSSGRGIARDVVSPPPDASEHGVRNGGASSATWGIRGRQLTSSVICLRRVGLMG